MYVKLQICLDSNSLGLCIQTVRHTHSIVFSAYEKFMPMRVHDERRGRNNELELGYGWTATHAPLAESVSLFTGPANVMWLL